MDVVSLAGRPDLLEPALKLGDIGAAFMQHDPVAMLTRDGIILWAAEDALDDRPPTCVAALDVQVASDRQGQGIAGAALSALRAMAQERGFGTLVIPVRPTTKEQQPTMPMAEFLGQRRADGLSCDPWLRAHERLGARIVKVAPFSMTIVGTLAQWESWTGAPLTDGPNVVTGALVPVVASAGLDVGVYVEPNVWVEHTLDPGPGVGSGPGRS